MAGTQPLADWRNTHAHGSHYNPIMQQPTLLASHVTLPLPSPSTWVLCMSCASPPPLPPPPSLPGTVSSTSHRPETPPPVKFHPVNPSARLSGQNE
ncbi:PREDICTED: inverted formin-2-like [Mesitornis unicolor]|uniref:inverted formin-2-like n=1 Tax=Mesitornis unicolor TaxID=54374 RepID=UPI0005293797|nr:PREDICTED: inverted formin-2-like [Mesitornis unicolor]